MDKDEMIALKAEMIQILQLMNTIEDKVISKQCNLEAELAMLKMRFNRHIQIGNPCHVADKQQRNNGD